MKKRKEKKLRRRSTTCKKCGVKFSFKEVIPGSVPDHCSEHKTKYYAA